MRPLSIRLRLSLMMLAFTLVIIVASSIGAYREFEESLLGNIDVALIAMGKGMWATLDGQESRESLEAEFRAITGYDESGVHTRYRIWTDESEKNVFFSGSLEDPFEHRLLYPLPEQQPDLGKYSLFSMSNKEASGRKRPFRVIWLRLMSEHKIMNIVVARSCVHVYRQLTEFLTFLLMVGGSAIVLTVLLVPAIISHGLRAITKFGIELGHITHSNLKSGSHDMPQVPVELTPFKSALQEMLLRLHRAIQQQEQLTADVSHELRSPLAVIKSTLQTLRMQSSTLTEFREGIDDTLEDVDRMTSLVSQLLSLARLDAAHELSSSTELRLDSVLESITNTFRKRVEHQDAKIVYRGSTPVIIRGNEAELQQLFGNLLDNAIRYGTRHGLVCVDLQEEREAWATVIVHDEGGAIPPESLPHLFDRFYRVDTSRSHTSGGSGLGLAIAQKIIQRHHGEITITSSPDTGTSVIVRLPRL